MRRISKEFYLISECLLRLALLSAFLLTETATPFTRIIHKDEMYLYSNPHSESYFPTFILWQIVTFIPPIAIGCVYLRRNDLLDAGVALLAVTLLMPLNGFITNCLKLAVGRPRPDFAHRCWPEGDIPGDIFDELPLKQDLKCSGDLDEVIQGRKSFPSGHSSFSFATFGFVFLYLSAKMKTFASGGNFLQSYKLALSVLILLVPTLIAVSRTCDYHHHWQDVTIGGLLGFALACIVYRFYYPSLTSPHCDLPYAKAIFIKQGTPIIGPIATPINDPEASPLFDQKRIYTR